MRRMLVLSAGVIIGALSFGAASGSAADEHASCNGILVSSAAGTPRLVADLTLEFHQIAKDLGFPPGLVVDAPGGRLHSGSVEACLDDLGT
jgi:hypothetical protein